jgi:mycofactocin precursor
LASGAITLFDNRRITSRSHAMTEETATPVIAETEAAPVVEQDLLVEDVSIDGMCGVY